MAKLATGRAAEVAFPNVTVAVATRSDWAPVRAVESRIELLAVPYLIARVWHPRERPYFFPLADPVPEITPLWECLQGLEDARLWQKEGPPVICLGSTPGEVIIKEYFTDRAVLRPFRFRIACVLYQHEQGGTIVVSNQRQPFPRGSLTIDFIQYSEPRVKHPVVRQVCFEVLTRERVEVFEQECLTRPSQCGVRGDRRYELLQDMLWRGVRDFQDDRSIVETMASARDAWQKLADREAPQGWFSDALASSRRATR